MPLRLSGARRDSVALVPEMTEEQTYTQFTDKYRPRKLSEVVGQKVAVGMIESMISKKEVAPFMILSGPYGTGKTTLARIIARYVNCATGNACGTCRSCELMDSGRKHPDVLELNAANSRGIEDVRELIQLSELAPRSPYRVIILDEAQQFTGPAAQVLLKPLEEPSKRTIWILCTTDPQKILATIRSRAKNIKLFEAPVKSIVTLLNRVCKAEGLNFPEKSLETIATLAAGHPRNALNILEQAKHYVASAGADANIEDVIAKAVDEMASIPPEVLCSKYVQAVLDANVPVALACCKRVEHPEYFLQVAYKYLKGVVHVLYGVEAKPEIEMFVTGTDFKRKFDKTNIIQLMELHLNALQQAKSYGVEGADVLDLIVLKSLEYISASTVKK